MTTEAATRIGNFVISRHSGRPCDIQLDAVDIIVCVASWEARCVAVTQLSDIKAHLGLLLSFRKGGGSGRRAQHFELLREWLGTKCSRVYIADYENSTDVFPNIYDLADRLADIVMEFGRTVHIAFDVSSCPKAYMLFVLGFLGRLGYAFRFSLLYAGGEYIASPESEGRAVAARKVGEYPNIMTEGRWSSVQVPYFEGQVRPERRRQGVVSIGFDAVQATKLLKLYEADEYTIILPSPGLTKEYTRRALAEVEKLRAAFDKEKMTLEEFGASDVEGLSSYLNDRYSASQIEQEIIFFCLGPKTHAVSMAISGLLDPDIPIICRSPERYVEHEVIYTGQTWLFRLDDTSVPK
jgi:hypothetical protein